MFAVAAVFDVVGSGAFLLTQQTCHLGAEQRGWQGQIGANTHTHAHSDDST